MARGLIFDLLSRVTPAIAVDTDGLRLYVSTADAAVSRVAFASGLYDFDLFARVSAELDRAGLPGISGGGFLEVGAHIGTATCVALGRYGATHAWAFEPSPENVRLLRLNLLANDFTDRASVFPYAVSDARGRLTLELSPTNWGDHRVRAAGDSGEPPAADEIHRRTIEVASVKLDDVLEEHGIDLESVRLAWIDTQGHEAQVLAGATRLLASDVPIVCEYWPYGLRRADGLERFAAVVARSRSTFIDLGSPDGRREATANLSAVCARQAGRGHTDLLLLPGSVAP